MNLDVDHLDAEADREHRIEMALAVAIALQDARAPDPKAAAFVGSALLSYFRGAGDLVRDCLRIGSPQGSRRTPPVVASELFSSSYPMRDAEDD